MSGGSSGSAHDRPQEAARSADRYLIVNADDFGISPGVNRGIAAAHEDGIVTSASLMVRYEAAQEAADYARTHTDLSLGLHVDLAEWAYRDGAWDPLYEVVPPDDAKAIAAEIERQLARFRWITGTDPTHLDSHQHVHQREPTRSRLRDITQRLGVPLRHYSPLVQYRGDFYGQLGKGEPYSEAITTRGLLAIIDALPPGVTELACHPGLEDDMDTMYRTERTIEVRTLCDPRIRAAIQERGIQLCSFASVRAMASRLPNARS